MNIGHALLSVLAITKKDPDMAAVVGRDDPDVFAADTGYEYAFPFASYSGKVDSAQPIIEARQRLRLRVDV